MGWLAALRGGGSGVGPREAERLMAGGALLLDVREPSEWRAGHAPAALHVPLGELQTRVTTLPRDRRIVVACRSGGRSARAVALLRRSGLDAVNLTGGMRAWVGFGQALEAEGGGGGRVE